MALPPLLLLQDIALTFGGTPLIESAELSVSPGERACLVGRNGSGKSTLLKIAAGLVEADRGKRFVQPGRHRALSGRRSPTFRGYRQHPGLCGGGPRTGRRSLPGALSPGAARADRRREDRRPLRRRGPPRGAGPCAGAPARHPAARRADEPSRPAGHRMAGRRAEGPALGARADQPRSPLPGEPVPGHRLARPRPHPPHGPRLRPFRGMARSGAGAGGGRASQARAQARRRGRLAALRRDGTAQAQRAPPRQPPRHAPAIPRAPARRRHGQHDAWPRASSPAPSWSRRRASRSPSASAPSSRTCPCASCAATGSASSGRTAPARPPSSTCSPACSRPMPAGCGSAPTCRW